jgi:predicted house-cleaning noncanonical NTP pyrophosphatase (MazG superfamily)
MNEALTRDRALELHEKHTKAEIAQMYGWTVEEVEAVLAAPLVPHKLIKLVRDHTPQVTAAAGLHLTYRVCSDADRRRLLRRKLLEEVSEFLDSGDVEELVDIVEVCLALAAEQGISHEKLDELREGKVLARGAYRTGVVWTLEPQ